MMTASLEYIDTFRESYDTDSESDDLSLESFIYNSGVIVECDNSENLLEKFEDKKTLDESIIVFNKNQIQIIETIEI
jgi:hypothetical protein